MKKEAAATTAAVPFKRCKGRRQDGNRDRKVPLLICQSIFVIVIVIVIVIVRMPHICGMDTYGMKIMPQMSGIATFQDIYGMLIFEDEHAIDV